MMRVMVVEDEEMIRKGIVMAVDWAALDCIGKGAPADLAAELDRCLPALVSSSRP